jgi:hypothetical protein
MSEEPLSTRGKRAYHVGESIELAADWVPEPRDLGTLAPHSTPTGVGQRGTEAEVCVGKMWN